MIKPTYHINKRTLAILPAKQIEYDTIVIEQQQTLHVRQTSLKIIKNSCKKYWATYEGRREAVIHHMNFQQKVPIPISIMNQLYFFPTHSPNHLDNSWIAAQQITQITRHPHSRNRQSIIQFACGQTLTIDVSTYILRQQAERTFACMYEIGRVKK